MLFKRIHTAPNTVVTGTRDSFFYLYRSLRRLGVTNKPVKSKILNRMWRYLQFSILIYLSISYAFNWVTNVEKFSFYEFLSSLRIGINCWGAMIKFIVLAGYFDWLDGALDELDEMEKYCETEEEFHKIRKAVALGNKAYVFYFCWYSTFAIATLSSVFVSSTPPYNAYFPFLDWRTSKSSLYIQASLEFLLVGQVIFTATATDGFGLIFVMALTAHIDILKNRVKNLDSKLLELSESKRYDELIRCIKVHQSMLRYCDIISTPMSASIFVQFLICGTIIGVCLINFMVSPDGAARVAVGSYVIAVLIQSFPLCYFCTYLTDTCYELADAVFHSNWMFEDQRYKKAILQLLQKVQQPMTFTALNIFDINLATNISVAKFAVTVYAIANTMNLGEKFKRYGESLDEHN